MFSTDESSQFNSSYTVSFIINAMPFPFSIPVPLSYLTVVRCPFCKTANYAVEYRGVKSKEEKGLEQIVRINLHILASFFFLFFLGLISLVILLTRLVMNVIDLI